MAEPIRIEFAHPAYAGGFVASLAARGITAAARPQADGSIVEILLRRERTEWLLRDVLEALESWVNEHDGAAPSLQVGPDPGHYAYGRFKHVGLGEALLPARATSARS